MGRFTNGGAGLDSKTSPHRAAIEKAQTELRQEVDVREERRRELEFLEKGGNPLDFKIGSATSISVQSTSVTDQHADHEAKGSFALAASPHGDSVDSSARPLCREPSTADNLLLIDGEKNILQGDRNAADLWKKGDTAPPEQPSNLDKGHNTKKSEDPQVFRRLGVRSQAYARRNRSKSSRDSAHAGQNNRSIILSSCPHCKDVKCSLHETLVAEDQSISSICNSKTTSPNANVVTKNILSDNQMDIELCADLGHEAIVDSTKAGHAEKRENDGKFSQIALEKDGNAMPSLLPCSEGAEERCMSSGLNCAPSAAAEIKGNFVVVGERNGCSFSVDKNAMVNDIQNGRNCSSDVATIGTKCLDLEFPNRQSNGRLDEKMASVQQSVLRKVNGNALEKTSLLKVGPPSPAGDVEKKNVSGSVDMQAADSFVLKSAPEKLRVQVKAEEEIRNSRSDVHLEGEPVTSSGETKPAQSFDNSDPGRLSISHGEGLPCSLEPVVCEPAEANMSAATSACATELQTAMNSCALLGNKEREDAILEEARVIEANRRRIRELCLRNVPSKKQRKSHWDFVLEEMAWLANDFMQERLWKTTAAGQISHWIAFSGQASFKNENLHRKQRKVAHTLAKAVMQFWNAVEVLQGREDCNKKLCEHISASLVCREEAVKENTEVPTFPEKADKDMDRNGSKRRLNFSIQRYALRFLKYSLSADCSGQAVAPMTPDQISDRRILQLSWEDQYLEESLSYTVPSGAMEQYRKSVESLWAQDERIGNSLLQEDIEKPVFESVAAVGARENVYDDDDGETGIYYLPGAFEGSKSSKFVQRTKKTLQKSYTARAFDVGSDLPYENYLESKLGNQPSLLTGKRPLGSLNVCSIPTKRLRTAARPRIASPFGAGAGTAVGGQFVNKTDASSGDTSSFHDDQVSVQSGPHPRKLLEVESTGEFIKQLAFDATDTSTKLKKKKGSSAFEQRWQLNSVVQCEQRDNLRKRLDTSQLESNGNTGIYAQHAAKKSKILKQLPDACLETSNPLSGSILSPVASQMSNMSNPNKLIKMIANRDRGRKIKGLKISAGQSGSGSPWSVYEDQALVVLVHDMGPNWELVSDAINSTLQFKCIFRKPKECKERHKELMDRNSGDGADSAEDSGSSQPYPSTLPGIPKGTARQLFQRLQGPMEEETLKAHFEKIILIGKQLHSHRNQKVILEGKQITATVHSSHYIALAQACPNNLNGSIWMPLDLCDETLSSPDVVPSGYQGSLNDGLAVASHQGSVPSVLPASGANSMLHGSSGVVLGSSLPSSSAPLNGTARDIQRYGMQRPSCTTIGEQQRVQQYNHVHLNRNMQHSTASVSGALPAGTDRGFRMPPEANGMGMMCGVSGGMAMTRPGFQGIGSQPMINMGCPGNVLSSNGVGMQGPVNIHNVAVSGQVNPVMRPREALQMLRPGQNPDEQRQMIMQELQMQVTQGNGPGVIPYNGMNTTFPNQTVPPAQSFAVQHQQQQQMPQRSHLLSNSHHPHLQGSNHNPHQQAFVMCMSKESQLQQRLLHQPQQQQYSTPNTSIPHSQSQLQQPVSPLINSSRIQQQSSAQSVSQPSPNSQHPLTSTINSAAFQAQQKQHHGPQGLNRNPQTIGALPNQMSKQRQHQQFQQPRQQHLQQRQQSQQQAKVLKGLGRGSVMVHHSVDASNVNGISPAAGMQVPEKGEQPVMHLMQGQGLYPGSNRNLVSLGKQLGSQSLNQVQQQKILSRPLQPLPKQQSQTPHLDNSQGQVQLPSNHTLSSSHRTVMSSPQAMNSEKQQQQLHRQTSQPQLAVQRILQKNRQTSSDGAIPSHANADGNSQLTNSTFHMGPSTLSNCAVPNNVPAVSSASPPSQLEESFCDTNMVPPTSNLSSFENTIESNTSVSEPIPISGQTLVNQGHFSGSISNCGQDNSAQWQQPPQQQQHQITQQQKQPQKLQKQQQGSEAGSLNAQPPVSGPG